MNRRESVDAGAGAEVEAPKGADPTWAQRLLWTGQQLHPDAPLYNMVLAFEVRGAFDGERFARAFQSVVDRADALRSVFLVEDGAAVVHVRPPSPVQIESVDVSAASDPEGDADAWMEARSRRILDPTECLFDCALLRLADGHHIWYLNQHHLITDAWSAGLVFRYVSEAYAHESEEDSALVRALPSYGEFAEFLERAQGSRPQLSARAHWRDVKSQSLEPTALYGKRATRGGGASTRTERLTVRLGAERSSAIRELAQSAEARGLTEHASRFNVFAAFVLGFMSRVSGDRGLAIGAPAHNRATVALKNTVGVFIEVFPLRAEVHADTTFSELLASVKREAGMFLRYAQPGTSDAALNRSVNVILNYINATFGDFAGLDCRSRWIHPGHGDSAHDLRVQVHDFDDDDSFVLHLDMATDRFSPQERELAARHLTTFIDSALASPHARLSGLSLIDDAEREALDAFEFESNGPTLSGSVPRTVLEAFRACAAAHPERTALVSGDRQWTYGELQRRAVAVARDLEKIGAQGQTVFLALPRSAEAVIAILGTLEAGGAFVPIDPDAPGHRIAHILEATDAAAAVGRTGSALTGVPMVYVDPPDDDLPGDDPPDDDPSNDVRTWIDAHPSVEPTALAYVLFTSGSSGRPKGVMVEHASLAHYAAWAASEYLEDGARTMALCTPLTFDLTVTSIFAPLVGGGTVVVYPDKGEAVDTAVLDVFAEDAVDAVKLTPSHLELTAGSREPLERIRVLIVGGEELRTDVARAALARLPGGGRIINEYGPTEATVACALHDFDLERDLEPTVPIGRPIAGATLQVTDLDGIPTPIGVIGEIRVGGPGVARGYVQEPEATAAGFVPSPTNGGRVYRTGDLGCWRPDGTLEYHGRSDRQVKIQGVRIEPGEVEAALAEHPAVLRSVVLASEKVAPRHVVPSSETELHCTRCGIPASHPDAELDQDSLCSLCVSFEGFRTRATEYFGSMEELRDVLRARGTHKTGVYDCLMLLSGGKDSSYALYRLVEMGLTVLTVTLDNGFISDGAKQNIRRVAEDLGVDHEYVQSDSMNEIFVDSLERFSNVCQGCFKTMYTLAFNLALERGIPSIVTGLSRGQFFETRLTEELFLGPPMSRQGLELVVLDARKAYHRVPDLVNSTLDTEQFGGDEAFEAVSFVDFYRFCDVELEEMLTFLDKRAPWIRPADTGRSTNCLINDVGIYVHQRERGFHNYALPYSWDVRLGHKERAAALDELDDDIDLQRVERILDEIGYVPKAPASQGRRGRRLAAFVVGPDAGDSAALREFLETRLPSFMIPSHFVRVDEIPLTPHGKVDAAALWRLASRTSRGDRSAGSEPPATPTEVTLAQLWSDALEVADVDVHANFFDLGGDSITAIRLAARANALGVPMSPNDVFRHQTIRALAGVVDSPTGAEFAAHTTDGAAGETAAPDDGTEPSLDDRTLEQVAALLQRADSRRGTDQTED